MIDRTFNITNERGFHFRPSCLFAERANKFDCDIFIVHDGKRYRGKTSMQVLAAGIRQGDKITIICDGADEKEAMSALGELIESEFDLKE